MNEIYFIYWCIREIDELDDDPYLLYKLKSFNIAVDDDKINETINNFKKSILKKRKNILLENINEIEKEFNKYYLYYYWIK
jgi:hypothetical protein